MKKIALIAFALLALAGCTEAQEPVETERAAEVRQEAITEYSGEPRYLIVLELKQSHFTLDITEHIKDSMNKVTIPVFVDEEFYNSHSVGDALEDSFRWGSFAMSGSFGNWKVTISEKQIVNYD